MDKIKQIKSLLIEKKIKKYKIIKTTEKSFLYKSIYDNESNEESILEKIIVIFKNKNKTSKFTICNLNNNQNLSEIINNCISNSDGSSSKWHDDIIIGSNKNNFKEIYEDFNSKNELNLIKNEFNKIKNETKLSLNLIYKVKYYKNEVLTNNQYIKQYHRSSEGICLENITFQKKALFQNIYSSNNFSKQLIKILNNEIIPFKKLEINLNEVILIKTKAIAQILNVYIKNFYASNIYSRQSFIKKTDINKKIVGSSVTLSAAPFYDIFFDSEGSKIENKTVIDKGILKNILGNNALSEYLNINCYGNASYDDINNISHQRLIFSLPKSKNLHLSKIKTIIENFENPYIDFQEKSINGVATYSKENNYYKSSVVLNLDDFFDNMYAINNNEEWINNVFCKDIVICKDIS